MVFGRFLIGQHGLMVEVILPPVALARACVFIPLAKAGISFEKKKCF